jgi:hypothetical protein
VPVVASIPEAVDPVVASIPEAVDHNAVGPA